MASYLDIQNQIATDLRRSNLTSEIAQAILDAITDHDSEEFWFNRNDVTPYTIQVLPGGSNGQDDTLLPVQTPVQEFIHINEVRANPNTAGTGLWYTVKRAENFEIDVLRSTASTGQPGRWAFAGQFPNQYLRIWPTPALAGGYPIRIFGHFRSVPLVNGSDTNMWTVIPQAKNLIRYTTLKRLFAFPIRDQTQMQLAQEEGLMQLEYLRRETERRRRKGRMRAYG